MNLDRGESLVGLRPVDLPLGDRLAGLILNIFHRFDFIPHPIQLKQSSARRALVGRRLARDVAGSVAMVARKAKSWALAVNDLDEPLAVDVVRVFNTERLHGLVPAGLALEYEARIELPVVAPKDALDRLPVALS